MPETCPACAQQNPSGTAFCLSCGRALQAPPAAALPSQPPPPVPPARRRTARFVIPLGVTRCASTARTSLPGGLQGVGFPVCLDHAGHPVEQVIASTIRPVAGRDRLFVAGVRFPRSVESRLDQEIGPLSDSVRWAGVAG